jgi:leucyl-tRNA synthetase
MAVPAHDERDYQFAVKYGIPVVQVVEPVRIDTNNPHKEGYPVVERNMVHGIIRDPKTNKYLMLNWSSNPWTTFILGGKEDGEDGLEAITREIKEETGYSNLKFLYHSIQAYSEYCADHKQQNRIAHPVAYFFEVTEETTHTEVHDEEKQKHTMGWVDISKELPKNFTCSEWDIFKETIKHQGFYPNGEDGRLTNSGEFNGLTSQEARKKITEKVGGKIVTKSKLRDWVFARQRYWGEPIPIVHRADGTMYPVHESNLPIILPQVEKYEPTDNGESPLYQVPTWVNVKGYIDEAGYFHEDESKEEVFRRETDTMPQWAGSSWYFMRYIDPKNANEIGDKKLLGKWLPVDWYNGGMEHTTLHLLYSRFWYKFLFDLGLVPTSEPYYKRTSQGMILGEGGVKMSKSLGNVVNPDTIVKEYGADVLRLYEMFVGPFDQAVAWNPQAISGVKRFLEKVYTLKDKVDPTKSSTLPITHQTIKKVSLDIESMSFNTSVSQMMILVNTLDKEEKVSKKDYMTLLQVLAPFAPHLTEELWGLFAGDASSIHLQHWPTHDENMLFSEEVTIAVSVGGKMRGTLQAARDLEDSKVLEIVKNHEIYQKYVGNQEPKRVVIVKNKIVNIVI